MSCLHLLPMGEVAAPLLEWLRPRLEAEFGVPAVLLPGRPEPESALHPVRGQHHSSELLAWLQSSVNCETWRLLAVTAADLYIPVLTFVFGEAQLEGRCALVSTHRLRQEFYGLPADPELLLERLLREAVHELGHTLQLRHCDDYQCAMSRSHSVEWIDLKGASLCDSCRLQAGLKLTHTRF